MSISSAPARDQGVSVTGLSGILVWLWGSAALVFAMAIIGAVTRLTESGLSIMEWNVFAGTFPPLSQAEWDRLFEMYKLTGEYQKQHLSALDMSGFKQIFWWEYIHRLWGRLIGMAFLIGLIAFAVVRMRGGLSRHKWLMPHAIVGFLLICFQGFLGWYMVSSGFDTELVDVSAYRLAAHLGLAVVIFIYFVGLGIRAQLGTMRFEARLLWNLPSLLVALIFVTLLSGAFVAGLNAGLIYNEFPTMGGALVPADYQNGLPWFRNPFENPTAAQLHHRVFASVAALVVIGATIALIRSSASTRAVRSWAWAALMVVIGQYLLGVLTLLYAVPIPLGAAHQGGALTLLATLTILRAHNNQANLK
ncbi:MAG: COX15/CtaA family protein [Alphaproteobacteria bacterium]